MFEIFEVDLAAKEDVEPLGKKPKFWFRREDGKWLFKSARENTGEHWAEKLAAEIARLIELPAARVSLANCSDLSETGYRSAGVIVKSFVDESLGEELVHGNEALSAINQGYDKSKKYRQNEHTVDQILAALYFLPSAPDALAKDWVDEVTTFIGYLLLDALITNVDRHHENWGILIRQISGTDSLARRLAPTYDHASSLGREHRDFGARGKRAILDRKGIPDYIERASGAVYWESEQVKGPSPIGLLRSISQYEHLRPNLVKWRSLISDLNSVQFEELLHQVPDETMSKTSKEFALAMLQYSLTEVKKCLE